MCYFRDNNFDYKLRFIQINEWIFVIETFSLSVNAHRKFICFSKSCNDLSFTEIVTYFFAGYIRYNNNSTWTLTFEYVYKNQILMSWTSVTLSEQMAN